MSGFKTLLGASGLALALVAMPQEADAHGDYINQPHFVPVHGLTHGHFWVGHGMVYLGPLTKLVKFEPIKDKDGNLMGMRDPRGGPLGGYLHGWNLTKLEHATVYKNGDALFLKEAGSKELIPLDKKAFDKGMIKVKEMRVK